MIKRNTIALIATSFLIGTPVLAVISPAVNLKAKAKIRAHTNPDRVDNLFGLKFQGHAKTHVNGGK